VRSVVLQFAIDERIAVDELHVLSVGDVDLLTALDEQGGVAGDGHCRTKA